MKISYDVGFKEYVTNNNSAVDSYKVMISKAYRERIAYHKVQNIEEIVDLFEVIRAVVVACRHTLEKLEQVRAEKPPKQRL